MVLVYKILDQHDEVVWVGMTENPKQREGRHRSNFKKVEKDVRMVPISWQPDRKIAYVEQIRWQKHYGLETDSEKQGGKGGKVSTTWLTKQHYSNAGKNSKGGPVTASRVYTCKHCGKTGKGPTMNRWHNNNCKHANIQM